MTFKHMKFEDSSTMRSLVKVAQDKGWIKEESINKTASAPPADLQPTQDLMENLLKLCSGLRAQGFNKYADELESKFVVYKQAQTLYDVSKEDGDDLLHSAHPKGSHKLEGVEGNEACIEDLIDKHTQHLKMVEKQPTGKLASSRDIIDAVKVVLGQDKKKELILAINAKMSEIKNKVDRVFERAEPEITFSLSIFKNYYERLIADNKLDSLKKLKTLLTALQQRLRPSGMSGMTEESWGIVGSLLIDCDKLLDEAIYLRQQYIAIANQEEENRGKPPEPAAAPVDQLINKGTTLVNTLKAYLSVAAVARNPQAQKWIQDEVAEIADVLKRYNSAKATGQLEQVKSALEAEMNEKQKEVNDFANQVIHPGATS